MTKDPLLRKIQDGLERIRNAADGEPFEDVMLVLLKKEYPTLSPVEGGSDSGFDGEGHIDGRTIQMISTIQEDVLENVTRSITKGNNSRGVSTP